jgi:hypothetical protein
VPDSGTGNCSGIIPNPVPAVEDHFGYSVSVSGELLAVGVFLDDPGLILNAGSVYLYERNSGTGEWEPADTGNLGSIEGNIASTQPSVFASFGISVSVSGDVLVVGETTANAPINNAGSVYVYERNLQTGVWQPANTGNSTPGQINNPLPEQSDFFGASVSISGDLLAVGVPSDILFGPTGASGSVFLYERDSQTGEWQLADTGNLGPTQGNIANPQPQLGAEFGTSVSLSGDRLSVGVPGDDSAGGIVRAGCVYLYERNSQTGVWEPTDTGDPTPGHIPNPEPNLEDQFGDSVSLSGGILAVGKRLDDALGTNVGSVYIYERDIQTGVWQSADTGNLGSIAGKIDNPQPWIADAFGEVVSISGYLLAVGNQRNDSYPPYNTDTGSIYLYERNLQTGVWQAASTGDPTPGHIPNPIGPDYSHFGGAVSVSGNLVAVGVSGDTFGRVHLYVPAAGFVRGDHNVDGQIDVGDGIAILGYLFSGDPDGSCNDATDANDDGGRDIGDAIFVLDYLFSDGPQPPTPFPCCGVDPTDDALDCAVYNACP